MDSSTDMLRFGSTDLFKYIWNKLSSRWKTSFFTGVFMGLLTHIYMITNKIPNWDDVSLIPETGMEVYGGRWLGNAASHLFSQWSAPGINGVCAVILMALAACLCVRILQIKTQTGAALCAAIFVTFPAFTANMTFMYTAAPYSLAAVLMCLAVYLMMRYRFGWIASVILQLVSMAIYQTYFALGVALVVLALLRAAAEEERAVEVVKRGFRYLITLILGMAAYLVGFRVTTANLPDFDTFEYRGIEKLGREEPVTYFHAVLRAYHRVLEYFILDPPSYARGAMHGFNIAVCALIAILWLFVFVKKRMWRQPLRAVLYAAMTAILPLAMGLVFVMSVETQDASTNMLAGFLVVYLMLIVLCEVACGRQKESKSETYVETPRTGKVQIDEKTQNSGEVYDETSFTREELVEGARSAAQVEGNVCDVRSGFMASSIFRTVTAIVTCIVLCLSIYSMYRIDNTAYYRSYIAHQRVSAMYSRIIARLEEQDGFAYGQKVIIAGDWWPDTNILSQYNLDGDLYTDFDGIADEHGLSTEGIRTRYIRVFLGVNLPDVSQEELDAVKASGEYRAMPVYPAEGSITKMGDAWVVKLAEPGDSEEK
ncbi:Glucosyl transferase GtrII [Lachnospiraceae bacterium NK3A20]|nr:Glucosyl transferase GtrII [Lachnospiraceae bacterium NK3A20]